MIIALDIGGTKTLIAAFDEQGRIVQTVKFKTPKEYPNFKSALATNAEKFTTHNYSSGVIGIRGLLNRDSGILQSLLLDDSSPDWDNVAIAQDCQAVFKCSFQIENDSKLAGLSEAVLLPDFNKVLYVTISTGIGTAFIVNKQINSYTHDSEVGKSMYFHGGRYQKWESFASGHAMVTRYGKLAEDIDDPNIWDEISDDWAIGIINVCLAYRPEVVVIGGSVGTHFAKYKEFLEEAIEDLRPKEILMPPIRQASRPEEAVVYGCYELSKN